MKQNLIFSIIGLTLAIGLLPVANAEKSRVCVDSSKSGKSKCTTASLRFNKGQKLSLTASADYKKPGQPSVPNATGKAKVTLIRNGKATTVSFNLTGFLRQTITIPQNGWYKLRIATKKYNTASVTRVEMVK